MPNYSNVIPPAPRGPALPIKRTPAFSALVAIVTSPDLIGTHTHFWHGRTVPCTLPDCEPHKEGVPYRWHAYMSAWETKTGLHFIFEVTAAGAERFIEYRDHHQTLRGCLFQARRWHQRPNGRILIQTKPADLAEIRLPSPPDLTKCLAILWNLPHPDFAEPQHDVDRQMPAVRTNPKPRQDQ